MSTNYTLEKPTTKTELLTVAKTSAAGGGVMDNFRTVTDAEISNLKLTETTMPTITVFGSWGSMTADAASGLKLTHTPGKGCEIVNKGGYHNIERFDVDEWHRAYPDRDITADEIGILDIGFWDKQKNYEPAEPDCRPEWEAALRHGDCWFTEHGKKPTNDEEWATHTFGLGVFYLRYMIHEHELREDWPEVFTNADCMRGYRWACSADKNELQQFWEIILTPRLFEFQINERRKGENDTSKYDDVDRSDFMGPNAIQQLFEAGETDKAIAIAKSNMTALDAIYRETRLLWALLDRRENLYQLQWMREQMSRRRSAA
jgi:hypothetical protein